MLESPQTYNGMKVVLNPNMTVECNEEIERSWSERLFTLPWEPMKKTKIVWTKKPSPDYYCSHDCIVCHPEAFEKLKHAVDNQE